MDNGNLQEQLFEWFRWFHRHPEPAGAEHETRARIREILGRTGITVIDTPLKTGLVARVDGKTEGPVAALRCDIDALPIAGQRGSKDRLRFPFLRHPLKCVF